MHTNVDRREVEKFDAIAARWWDSNGPFRPLHDLNPARLEFIAAGAPLSNCRVIDVGCGGGVLSEAMARAGARVTGIDASSAAIEIARLHAEHSALAIDYRCEDAEDTAHREAASYDLVTCMELLEHVPNPGALIQTCATLVKPGGSIIFSTLNRTASAYLFGILGAEYLLQVLPRGTHEYHRFIKPSELANWVRNAGFQVEQLRGLAYNPMTRQARLTASVSINYLMHCRHPGTE
jgi:2-polyprenyl-6-hydroxyphenyl methylase/3-demethylubiquinone-9 3-methyltransferase